MISLIRTYSKANAISATRDAEEHDHSSLHLLTCLINQPRRMITNKVAFALPNSEQAMSTPSDPVFDGQPHSRHQNPKSPN